MLQYIKYSVTRYSHTESYSIVSSFVIYSSILLVNLYPHSFTIIPQHYINAGFWLAVWMQPGKWFGVQILALVPVITCCESLCYQSHGTFNKVQVSNPNVVVNLIFISLYQSLAPNKRLKFTLPVIGSNSQNCLYYYVVSILVPSLCGCCCIIQMDVAHQWRGEMLDMFVNHFGCTAIHSKAHSFILREHIKVTHKPIGRWLDRWHEGSVLDVNSRGVILSLTQRGFPKPCFVRPPQPSCQPVFLLDVGRSSCIDDRWLKCQQCWQADSTETGASLHLSSLNP